MHIRLVYIYSSLLRMQNKMNSDLEEILGLLRISSLAEGNKRPVERHPGGQPDSETFAVSTSYLGLMNAKDLKLFSFNHFSYSNQKQRKSEVTYRYRSIIPK